MAKLLLMLTSLLGLSADGYETIQGYTGENVTLSGPDCSSNTLSSVRLKRHGSEEYIYSCIDGHAMDPKHQDPSFVGRVEGMKCPMEDGNVPVTVENVTRDDTGEYEWLVINSDGTRFTSRVYLNVTDKDAADRGNRTGDDVKRNPTSGNSLDAGVIAGGTAAAVAAAAGIIMMITVYLLRGRYKRCTIPCTEGDQQNSDLPVTYREVKQQQV